MEKDMRFEMMKTLKGREDRFIYYIAGLNVASIGFTLSKTFDITPNRVHDILLAASLICWVISITASFRWIFTQFRTMENNMGINDLLSGLYDKDTTSEIDLKNLILQGKSQLEKDSLICEKAIKSTLLFFIIGVMLFLLWRVVDVFQIW
jgi:hypothetical protein